MIDWRQRYFRWFLRELLAALEIELRGRDLGQAERSRVELPGATGQVSRGADGLIATPHQSLLQPRPTQRLASLRMGGEHFALGDGRRTMPLMFPTPTFVPPTATDFADFLMPHGPPMYDGGLPFGIYATSPLYLDGLVVAAAAYPLLATPQGAWRVPYPAPTAYTSALGYLPLIDGDDDFRHEHYLFFFPGADTATGMVDSSLFGNRHIPASNAGPFDWRWELAAMHEVRSNIQLPWMAGVDGDGVYIRVPMTVAASREIGFAYLNGWADEWTFSAYGLAGLGVLYGFYEWPALTGSVAKEAGFPYIEEANLPETLVAVPDFETIFMDYPATAEWAYDAGADRWYVTNTAFKDSYPGDLLAWGQDWWGTLELSAHNGRSIVEYEKQVHRELGPAIDTVTGLERLYTVTPTTKVRPDGSTDPGPGALRVERFRLKDAELEDDWIIHSTTPRRVVDRLVIAWSLNEERAAGPAPGPTMRQSSAPWNGHERIDIATAVFLDWGVCSQDYRARVVQREWDQAAGYRARQLYLVIERRNNGGDFIAERGLTHWGRLFASNGYWFRPEVRWRLPGDIEDAGYGHKWWEDYTLAQQKPLFLGTEWESSEYFRWWSGTGPIPGFPVYTIPRLVTGSEAVVEDPVTSQVERVVQISDGRIMSTALGDEYASGRSIALHSAYGSPPMTPQTPSQDAIAQPWERAGIWYQLLDIRVGHRAVYPPTNPPDRDDRAYGPGEVQVVVDDDGVPFFAPETFFADKHPELPYPDLAQILARYVEGANLYEGPFGTLPAPLAGTSRTETFCGLAFDAADLYAVDVVTHPEGGYLCLAVAADWGWRISRGTPAGEGAVSWEQTASGAHLGDLLIGDDVASFAPGDAPIQEYRFAMPEWPTPIGSLRSAWRHFAFRASGRRASASGDDRPAIVRIAGRVTTP